MATSNIPFGDTLARAHTIASNTDLNNITAPGLYRCASSTVAGTLVNCPYSTSTFVLFNFWALSVDYGTIQLIVTGSSMYCRRYANGAWGGWYKYTGTAV